jgi:prevent-host-death family protein
MEDILSIGVFEAKTRFSELVETCATGREITVTKRGEPIIKLVPIKKGAQGRADALAALREIRKRSAPGPSIRELLEEGRR